MKARTAILNRVRKALSVPTRATGRHVPQSNITQIKDTAREHLPPGGRDEDECLALFQENLERLNGQFKLFADNTLLHKGLTDLAFWGHWEKVATHQGPQTDSAVAALTNVEVLNTSSGYDVEALESCHVAITQCEALIAQTGSVLITNTSSGGRALSVLPPHHVVLATRSQLLGDMAAGFAHLRQRYGSNYPSFISFVSGPSRTADIERTVVLGAHGPVKLSVLVLDDLSSAEVS